MDRRRLEDSHLKFAVLQVMMWYSEALQLEEFPLSASVNETLSRFTAAYYIQFTRKYAGILFWLFAQQ